MLEFEDSTPLLGDSAALRERLSEQSHLFFRRLLDPEQVFQLRRDIVTTLATLDWLAEGRDPMDAIPGRRATGEGNAPSPEYYEAYEAVQRLQSFHELAHSPALVGAIRAVVGEDVFVHPRKIFRVAPSENPRYVTPPHQDFRLIQGTVDTLTTWLPLGDCPEPVGGLRVLAGSHKIGLGQVHAVEATGGVAVEADDDDPRWTSTSFQAGDVLVFHSLTVHGAKPNVSDRLRLSADFRYQAVSQPVVDLSLGPHYSPPLPGFDELTRGWTSTFSVDIPRELTITSMGDPYAKDLAVDAPRLIYVTFGGE